MKAKEIIEGNILIAEADGFKLGKYPNLPNRMHKTTKGYEYGVDSRHLSYHSKWEDLMPIVELVESLTAEDGRGEVNFIVTIEKDYCCVSQGGEAQISETQAYDNEPKIEVVWRCVVGFFKWHKNYIRDNENE